MLLYIMLTSDISHILSLCLEEAFVCVCCYVAHHVSCASLCSDGGGVLCLELVVHTTQVWCCHHWNIDLMPVVT